MVLPAIFLAALFFLIKEGVPALMALRSGVVRTRGHRPVRVARASEPERFRRLVIVRLKLAASGLAAAALLAAEIIWQALSDFAGA